MKSYNFHVNHVPIKQHSKQTYTRQKKTMHEGKKYSCDSCGFQAKERAKLISHQKSIHRGEKSQDCT